MCVTDRADWFIHARRALLTATLSFAPPRGRSCTRSVNQGRGHWVARLPATRCVDNAHVACARPADAPDPPGPTPYTPRVKLSRIIINGVALIAAALIVPGVHLAWKTDPTQTLIALLVLAFVFGVINAYIRPALRAISLPVNLLSMGLFGFFLNAGLLLLLAWLVDKLGQPLLQIGGFPPSVSATTLTAAIGGAAIITVVSTFLSVLLPDA